MAKKGLLVLVLAATFTAGSAFAQVQLSAGGGFIFDAGRTGGGRFTEDVPLTGIKKGGFVGSNALGFGGFLFLDATYAELNVAFMGGPNNQVVIMDGERKSLSDVFPGTPDPDLAFTALSIGLLGKYPIDLGKATIFPLAGIGYDIMLGMTSDGEEITDSLTGEKVDVTEKLSQLKFSVGVGGDFDINDNLYFRAEALGTYRLPNKSTTDSAKNADGISAEGGFGGTVKLAVGYRF